MPDTDVGNLTVTDNVAVTIAQPATPTASWTGLDPTKPWLAVIFYATATDVTLFSVG